MLAVSHSSNNVVDLHLLHVHNTKVLPNIRP
jgi:hypothetical protein